MSRSLVQRLLLNTATRTYSARTLSSQAALQKPSLQLHDTALELAWPSGERTAFDYQYLLDHCRCDRCFHPGTKQRLKTLTDFNALTRPTQLEIHPRQLSITWPGEHESVYPLATLRKAAYNPPLDGDATSETRRSLWTAQIARAPPSMQYDHLMQPEPLGDRAVLQWLDLVEEYGFCYVIGVPVTPQGTESLIRRIASIRETHYGGFWDFTADMSHGDLAYSNQALPAHTDTTYFTDPAGLQIFHCLHHAGEGGESLLVDGFYTASKLSKGAYDTLSRLRVPSHASGDKAQLVRPAKHATLTHDERGELIQLRWNNEDRGILGPGWTSVNMAEWYAAAREFEALNRTREAEYWTKLKPGTVVVINNWRVMHGRAAFTGSRRMCGAYIGADDWRSRRKSLRVQFDGVADVTWAFGW